MKKREILRNSIGVIVGLAVTGFFLALILYIGWSFYPLPENVRFLRPKSYRLLERNISAGSYLFEILSYITSVFLGGLVVASIVRLAKPAYSTLIALILFLLVLVRVIIIPQPIWVNALSLLTILPMGYLAGKLGERL